MSTEKKQITVSEILSKLESGVTRDQIKEEYGLSHREMQELFRHPKLKNRKTRKEVSFELVDDTEEGDNTSEEEEVPVEETQAEVQAEIPDVEAVEEGGMFSSR